MTNAEKYLKDGVSAEEFVKAVWGSCYNIPEAEGDRNYKDCFMYGASVERWLNEQVNPILTEDERVILRNMPAKEWNYIFRDNMGNIQFEHLKSNGTPSSIGRSDWYNHLFQFIKERRRIQHTRIIKGGIKQ